MRALFRPAASPERRPVPQVPRCRGLPAVSRPVAVVLSVSPARCQRRLLGAYRPERWEWLARRFPGLFDVERALRARTLREFDDAFTAPLHGFAGVDDYWRRASSKPHLHAIRVPTLVLNARNDPFVPAESLPTGREAGSWVTLWQPAHGGHVGFAEALGPRDVRGDVTALPRVLLPWLARAAGWRP